MSSPERPLLIIINADDLGASLPVNDAIFHELEAGRVTSTTILANGPGFEDAVKRVRSFPGASVGVHLNLTEYEPLSAPSALKSLLDSNGHLHPGLRYRIFTPRQLGAIYQEFAAQIERALNAGVRVSHLDSHWHIHTRPDFVPLVKALQHKFGIQRVRARLNLYPPDQPANVLARIAIPICNAALRCPPGPRTTDCMSRFSIFLEWIKRGYIPKMQKLELMVHPGHPERAYREEVTLLASEWSERLTRPFSRITFWQI